MSQAVVDTAPAAKRAETLALPRSGLELRDNTLYRTGRGSVVIAAHPLAGIAKLELTHPFDVLSFAFGLAMAGAALAAKAGMDSSTAGWIVGIGAGVLACLLMAGAKGLALEVTSGGVTAAYRLLDREDECEGFAVSTIEQWKRVCVHGHELEHELEYQI